MSLHPLPHPAWLQDCDDSAHGVGVQVATWKAWHSNQQTECERLRQSSSQLQARVASQQAQLVQGQVRPQAAQLPTSCGVWPMQVLKECWRWSLCEQASIAAGQLLDQAGRSLPSASPQAGSCCVSVIQTGERPLVGVHGQNKM